MVPKLEPDCECFISWNWRSRNSPNKERFSCTYDKWEIWLPHKLSATAFQIGLTVQNKRSIVKWMLNVFLKIKVFIVASSKTRTSSYIFLNFMFSSFSPRIFSMIYLRTKFHLQLMLGISSIIDFTLLCKKYTSYVFTF